MGLGAPKRRNKISLDPNNTSWSKSENSFGQKILCSQGWKPGDYLGVQNANHSDHYTAANASHIRILLREENLGLGAQIGKGNAETFGLSLFSGVLGRLNGKSDAELENQQSAMRDAELRNYHATKFGLMNFVSGGLLVGDTIQPVKPQEGILGSATSKKSKKQKSDGHDVEAEKRKKRENAPGDALSKKELPSRERLESVTPKQDSSAEHSTSSDGQRSSRDSDEKAAKKHRKRSRKERDVNETSSVPVDADPLRSKSEKRARKEQRRKRKEEKRLQKRKRESTPSASLPADPRLVRRRYIDQKRMASMDPQAMKEIFMLKAGA